MKPSVTLQTPNQVFTFALTSPELKVIIARLLSLGVLREKDGLFYRN